MNFNLSTGILCKTSEVRKYPVSFDAMLVVKMGDERFIQKMKSSFLTKKKVSYNTEENLILL